MSKKNKTQPDLSRAVMKKIKKEEIKMKPRFYFVLGSIFFGAGLAGSFLMAAFFVSMAFFRLRRFGPFGFLWFGGFGLRPFLVIFPWLPLGVCLIALFGGLALLRKQEISYKKNFLALIVFLVILIVLAGWVLSRLDFHRRMTTFQSLKPFYQEDFADRDWVVGRILTVGDKSLILQTPAGGEFEVVWDKKTLLPFGGDFEENQMIRVVGQWRDDVFWARGIARGGMHFRRWPTPHSFPHGLPREGTVRGRFR